MLQSALFQLPQGLEGNVTSDFQQIHFANSQNLRFLMSMALVAVAFKRS